VANLKSILNTLGDKNELQKPYFQKI
jgi:hypothetical protein